MGDLTIQLDRESTPGVHIARLAGPLDNRTADGFDEWLRKYSEHFGTGGTLHLHMECLECLSSRAISSIVFYFDKFQQSGGTLVLVNPPPTGWISIERAGLGPDTTGSGVRRPRRPPTLDGAAGLELPPGVPDPLTGPDSTT